MNYDMFRALWHDSLEKAGLLAHPTRPSERIHLNSMSREYNIIIPVPDEPLIHPFHVTARLNWQWDALKSARTATTEEDLLGELLGKDEFDVDTEWPWLRVDLALRAVPPLDALLLLPSIAAWQRWATHVASELSPLLPSTASEERTDPLVPLSWRGHPKVEVQCRPDGQLYLGAVELPAWWSIDLPRQWDDPERPPDQGTEQQVTDLFARLVLAIQVWEESLRYLMREKK